jgi:hypothetical protein
MRDLFSILESPSVNGDSTASERAEATPKTVEYKSVEEVQQEWTAFQDICQYMSRVVGTMAPIMVTASRIRGLFGITPTTVRRLAASGKVRSHHQKGHRKFSLPDVLLAVLNHGEGRVRRRRRNLAPAPE